MTINSPAAMIFAMYLVVAEQQGATGAALGHHPERHPQGIHRAEGVHLPAAPSMRLVTDVFAFCARKRRAGTPSR
jgi:methylmalonyl-CoA mutase N-terminal domain/subunit